MTKEYLTLFNAITTALEALEAIRLQLMAAQCSAEEQYISNEEGVK